MIRVYDVFTDNFVLLVCDSPDLVDHTARIGPATLRPTHHPDHVSLAILGLDAILLGTFGSSDQAAGYVGGGGDQSEEHPFG
jgi:hypothetical protein